MPERSLRLPVSPAESFFLWGPRQTGKSSLLRSTYPDAVWYDLLETDLYLRLTERPSLLREELLALGKPRLVVLDEIQKVPLLLDEVHALIERKWVFALCGSSARKIRRGHANLLGGRAVRHELFGFVSRELGRDFDLVRMLNRGYLPRHYLGSSPAGRLRAYVDDYPKEEITDEGLIETCRSFHDTRSRRVTIRRKPPRERHACNAPPPESPSKSRSAGRSATRMRRASGSD